MQYIPHDTDNLVLESCANPGDYHRFSPAPASNTVSFTVLFLLFFTGSKRSAHSNAYFYGFFNNKRIVLFDTLLINWDSDKDSQDKVSQNEESEDGGKDVGQEVRKKGCSDEEVVAVLSHELGHWSLNHNTKNIVVTQVRRRTCTDVVSHM